MHLRCTRSRTVGFKADGRTLAWSPREFSKEYATFKLPCGKCIDCILQRASDWATRAVHEASCYERNSFITLTYSDDELGDNRLNYEHFQLFIKKLRKAQNEPLGFMACGEYGSKTKRMHWHAIIFNWRPRDAVKVYTSPSGHDVFCSFQLTRLWGKGRAELGSVTTESAGYVARYTAKKLEHGEDRDLYKPIFKVSNKRAIGKAWLEKFYMDVFAQGHVFLKDGTRKTIPRYYEKWFKEHHPEEWLRYISNAKQKKSIAAQAVAEQEQQKYILDSRKSFAEGGAHPQTRDEVRAEISRINLKNLNEKGKF